MFAFPVIGSSFFVSEAWAVASPAAEPAANAAAGSQWMSFIPLLIIFVLFYLLVIRPQSKRIREHGAMLQALKPGDKVVTGGGLYATVIKVNDDDVTLEIASDVHVKAQKHTLSTLQETIKPTIITENKKK